MARPLQFSLLSPSLRVRCVSDIKVVIEPRNPLGRACSCLGLGCLWAALQLYPLPVCLLSCHAWQSVPAFPEAASSACLLSWAIPISTQTCCTISLVFKKIFPELWKTSHYPVYPLPFITKLLLASSCFLAYHLAVLFSGSCFCLIVGCSCQGHHQPVLPNLWSFLSLSYSVLNLLA